MSSSVIDLLSLWIRAVLAFGVTIDFRLIDIAWLQVTGRSGWRHVPCGRSPM